MGVIGLGAGAHDAAAARGEPALPHTATLLRLVTPLRAAAVPAGQQPGLVVRADGGWLLGRLYADNARQLVQWSGRATRQVTDAHTAASAAALAGPVGLPLTPLDPAVVLGLARCGLVRMAAVWLLRLAATMAAAHARAHARAHPIGDRVCLIVCAEGRRFAVGNSMHAAAGVNGASVAGPILGWAPSYVARLVYAEAARLLRTDGWEDTHARLQLEELGKQPTATLVFKGGVGEGEMNALGPLSPFARDCAVAVRAREVLGDAARLFNDSDTGDKVTRIPVTCPDWCANIPPRGPARHPTRAAHARCCVRAAGAGTRVPSGTRGRTKIGTRRRTRVLDTFSTKTRARAGYVRRPTRRAGGFALTFGRGLVFECGRRAQDA